ncbi:MAG: hypothetical protein ACFB20_05370 [Opitutales bacterium]
MKGSAPTSTTIPNPQEPLRPVVRAAMESPEELQRKFPRRAVLLPGGSPEMMARMKRLNGNLG